MLDSVGRMARFPIILLLSVLWGSCAVPEGHLARSWVNRGASGAVQSLVHGPLSARGLGREASRLTRLMRTLGISLGSQATGQAPRAAAAVLRAGESFYQRLTATPGSIRRSPSLRRGHGITAGIDAWRQFPGSLVPTGFTTATHRRLRGLRQAPRTLGMMRPALVTPAERSSAGSAPRKRTWIERALFRFRF